MALHDNPDEIDTLVRIAEQEKTEAITTLRVETLAVYLQKQFIQAG